MSDNLKILVVEDNDFVRMQIVGFLKEAAREIVECSDGREALERVGEDVDVAIIDVRMEPVDGFEFLRAIRTYELETPVILVTGDSDPELLNEASRWGVVAVLMKPVQKDRLLQSLARAKKMIKKKV